VARTLDDSPDPVRLGGVGAALAHALESRVDSEVRATLLGHLQRGGTPTAFDRVLSTRFGYAAAELVRQGRWGRMVALQGADIRDVGLSEVAGRNRTVPRDHELIQAVRGLGLCLGAPEAG
jgi:6-phosphofructokinase 1